MKNNSNHLIAVLLPILAVAVAVCAILPAVSTRNASAAWDGTVGIAYCTSGSGTASSPYLIDTPQQLAKLAQTVNSGTSFSGKYFALNADIDLGFDVGWTPIGTSSNPFMGIFFGNNKTIYGLKVRGILLNTENLGLFGVCRNATISSLTLNGTEIHSPNGYVGALCGNAYGCIVSNVNITGNLYIYSSEDGTSSSHFGGMFGRINSPAAISNCTVSPTGTIDSTHTLMAYSYYGGFVGDIRYSSSGNVNITDCSVNNLRVVSNRSSSTSDPTYCGGFFGDTAGENVTINFLRCGISDSIVAGCRYTGGFGYELLKNSSVTGCYVANVALSDIYNKTPSIGKMQVGGLLGYSNGVVQYSYVSLSSLSVPNQISSTYFINGTGHNVHSVVGNVGGNSDSSNHIYYVNIPLQYNSGAPLNVSTGTYGNNIGTLKEITNVKNGNVGWELYYPDGGVYWTQKNNEFGRPNISVVTYPLPTSSSEKMITRVTEYGLNNTITGTTAYKFSCDLNSYVSTSTSLNTSVTLYYNAGMTFVNSVSANQNSPSSAAYNWYFTRNDQDDGAVLETYGLENKSFTVPSNRNVIFVLHGETEKVFSITYADPDGNAVTPSSGAPTTFTISNPADISSVSTANPYWNLRAWQKINGQTHEDITNITVSAAQYSDIKLYASWMLKTETGSDGKIYNLICSFDNLEMFRDMVNGGQSSINAKLSPVQTTYKIARLRTRLGVISFYQSTVSTNSLEVQQNRTAAELYCRLSYLENKGFDVSTPEKYTTLINTLSEDRVGRLVISSCDAYTEDIIDSYGLKWDSYNPGQIGTSDSNFSGVFDGNNSTISGLTLGGTVSSTNSYFGLFRHTFNATIKDLTLSGGTLTLNGDSIQLNYNVYAAPLVSNALYSTIEGCSSSVPVDTSGLTVNTVSYPTLNIGGIIATGTATTVSDCNSTGTISLGAVTGSSYSSPLFLNVGGIVGGTLGAAPVNITRVFRSGSIESTAISSDVISIGGIIGWSQSPLNITDVVVMSDITANPTTGTASVNPLYMSGFAGRAGTNSTAPVNFTRCAYGGTISDISNPRYVGYSAFNGAIAGSTLSETAKDCYYDVFKNADDFRLGSLLTTDAFTGGFLAWQLQSDYMKDGGTQQIWGQSSLNSGKPMFSGSAENTVRKVEKHSGGYYLTLGNSLADVNNDRTVNANDVSELTLYALNKTNGVTEPQSCDINSDGTVDVFDVFLVEQIYEGNISLADN